MKLMYKISTIFAMGHIMNKLLILNTKQPTRSLASRIPLLPSRSIPSFTFNQRNTQALQTWLGSQSSFGLKPQNRRIHTPSTWQELHPINPYPKQYISLGGVAGLMIAVWADMNKAKIYDGTGTSQPKHTVYTGKNWIEEADETFKKTIPAGQLWSEFPPMFQEVVRKTMPDYKDHLVGEEGYLPLEFYLRIRTACIEYAKTSETLDIYEASAESVKVTRHKKVSIKITLSNGEKLKHSLEDDLHDIHFVNNANIPNTFDAHARLAPKVISKLEKSPLLVKELKRHGGTVDFDTRRIRMKSESIMDRTRLPFSDFFENMDPVASAIYLLGTSLSSNWVASIRKMHSMIYTLPSLKPGGQCNEVIFGTKERRVNFISEYNNLNSFNHHPYFHPKEQKVTINTDETDQGMLVTNIRRVSKKFYYTVQVTDLTGSTYSAIISDTGFVSATGSRPLDLAFEGIDEKKKDTLLTCLRPSDIYKSNKNHPKGSLPFSFEYSSHVFGLDKVSCLGRVSLFPLICDNQKRLADLAQRVREDFDLSENRIERLVKKYIEYRHCTHSVPTAHAAIQRFSELVSEAYLDQYGESGFNIKTIQARLKKGLSPEEVNHIFLSKKTNGKSPTFANGYQALREKYERDMSPKP